MNCKIISFSLLVFTFFSISSHAQTNYRDYLSSESIFYDDFSNNKIGWPTGLSADSTYSSTIKNGALEITSAKNGINPFFFITRSIDNSRDFEIEAEILFVKGEDNRALSLFWGKDANNNRYSFGISGNGQYLIFKYKGSFVNLAAWTASYLVHKNDYNKMSVRKIGPKYYFFLNETLVYITDFYPFFGNQIGFQGNQNTTMRANFLKISYLKPGSVVPVAKATTTDETSKTSFQSFAGISTDYVILTGGFDGKSYFQTTVERILVPKLTPSVGFGVQFGVKFGKGGFDFAYHFSRMPYTSMVDGYSGTSTNHIIRYLGFKMYLNSTDEKMIKPYVDLDLSVSISHFDKISYPLGDQSAYKSANYSGLIFGLGAGTLFSLNKHLALDLKILPELYTGSDVKPKNGTDYTVKKFNSFFMISSFGIEYYFNKK